MLTDTSHVIQDDAHKDAEYKPRVHASNAQQHHRAITHAHTLCKGTTVMSRFPLRQRHRPINKQHSNSDL